MSQSTDLTVAAPPALLELLADMVAERISVNVAPAGEPWMNSEEAAHYIGYRGEKPSKKMSELVKAGKLPERRDGNRYLFRRIDLDAYVEAEA